MSNNNYENYLSVKKGFFSWFYTLDHKRIGILYLFTVLIFFLIGGLFAILIRIILWNNFCSDSLIFAKYYNRLFTAHGLVMLFVALIPGIPSSLGNFILPLQIGTRDLIFPKLNLYSYYCFLIGILISVYCIFFGSIDTGWTLYAPYSITSGANIYLLSLAVLFFGTSSLMTSINFITSIIYLRAEGQGWLNIPIFTWSLFASSVIQLVATPVLGITILLLVFEKFFSLGIFDPNLGGDPILFQHLFWFYSHPVVYVMIVPAMGLISEIISVFSRKTAFGYTNLVFSSLVIAFFGLLIWGHHMFVAGQSEFSNFIFTVLTTLVAVPTSVKIFTWLSTLYRGSIKFDTPFIMSFFFIFLFTIGGLTGLMLNNISLNVWFHDTYYVVAHFHFILAGSVLYAFFAGLHFFWPKMFGRLYNVKFANIFSFMSFLGFIITFFSQFILGFQGMPRRYFHYLYQYKFMNRVSTLGAILTGLGFFLLILNLVLSFFNNSKNSALNLANPWNAKTIDWTETYSPPLEHNFINLPILKKDEYENCFKK